ncbi:hypothetical protein Trydic_g8671 [Trypoxylus dichotomus]
MLSGIVPSTVRCSIASMAERSKQMTDHTHLLYGHEALPKRLKPRKSLLQVVELFTASIWASRGEYWERTCSTVNITIWNDTESHAPGSELDWKTWNTLNRHRNRVGRSKDNFLCCK